MPKAARYLRTSADYTTTSTTFVDVDATNLALTITTLARRVRYGLVASGYLNNAAGILELDVDVDGTRQSAEGADGLMVMSQHATASDQMNASFSGITAVLTAAAHTFKLQWRVTNGAHTGTLSGASPTLLFWVEESMADA